MLLGHILRLDCLYKVTKVLNCIIFGQIFVLELFFILLWLSRDVLLGDGWQIPSVECILELILLTWNQRFLVLLMLLLKAIVPFHCLCVESNSK